MLLYGSCPRADLGLMTRPLLYDTKATCCRPEHQQAAWVVNAAAVVASHPNMPLLLLFAWLMHWCICWDSVWVVHTHADGQAATSPAIARSAHRDMWRQVLAGSKD